MHSLQISIFFGRDVAVLGANCSEISTFQNRIAVLWMSMVFRKPKYSTESNLGNIIDRNPREDHLGPIGANLTGFFCEN